MRGQLKTRAGDMSRGVLAEKLCLASLDIGKSRVSTKAEDMYQHWDFEHNGVKYDIKTSSENGCHWIETTNVLGHPGSLHGKADVIAFDDIYSFILVDRLRLQAFVEKVTIDEFKDKVPYYKYQRKGRKDVIVMIPTSDLKRLGFSLAKLVVSASSL